MARTLRHLPSQMPGLQYDGPTRRRQARAVRYRAQVDRGCPQTAQQSTSGTARHHRGCGRDQEQDITYSTFARGQQVTKQINITRQLTSYTEECIRIVRISSQYEGKWHQYAEGEQGAVKKVKSTVADDRGCP